ncbi:MAG: glycosyltransferase [Spirochaetes bacterium]|nr:glycosyltransferase [Spirochaetota bacterium]
MIQQFTDKRIRLFVFKENRGACEAANHCIKMSRGEYIAMLSSDDVFMPDKLMNQVAYLSKHKTIAAVFGYPSFIDSEGKNITPPAHFDVFRQENRSRQEWLRHFFYKGNCLCHPTSLIRKSVYTSVGLYDRRYMQIPDYDMWVRICMKYEIHIVPNENLYFRVHSNTSTINPVTTVRTFWEYEQALEHFITINDMRELKLIFPDMPAPYKMLPSKFIPFIVGMLAIDIDSDPLYRHFGLRVIHRFIKSNSLYNYLESRNIFSINDFYRLTSTEQYNKTFRVGLPRLEAAHNHNLHQIDYLQQVVAERDAQLGSIIGSVPFRVKHAMGKVPLVRFFYRKVLKPILMLSLKIGRTILGHGKMHYGKWMRDNEPGRKQLAAQRKMKMENRPLISVVVPAYKTSKRYVRDFLRSLKRQTYQRWELCVAAAELSDDVIRVLQQAEKSDGRIKLSLLSNNSGIALNTNAAIALATGSYIGFLDHDDILPPWALNEIAQAVEKQPEADFLYSDEDKINDAGTKRFQPHFKSDFNIDMLLSYNYICHFTVVKRSLGEKIGWLRDGYQGSQDYDFILRATGQAKCIVHIPMILYHWRVNPNSVAYKVSVKEYVVESAKKALRDYCFDNGIDADINAGLLPTTYRVVYHRHHNPLVSIIIPNSNHADDLRKCVHSIISCSSYRNYEILIMENGSTQQGIRELYEQLKSEFGVSIVSWEKPFNYAAVNNAAACMAKGEMLLFLNNDVEVITPQWMENLIEHALRPEIGAVGAKLYYPNNTIQHAGVILGIGGIAGHAHKGFVRQADGYFSRLKIVQNLSAVTGACLMTRKQLFRSLGGFDERFILAFNDVDYCIRLRNGGYRIVWTPYVELVHYESKSRGLEDTPEKQQRFTSEVNLFKQKWNDLLIAGDTYYNKNLTLVSEDFDLRISGITKQR